MNRRTSPHHSLSLVLVVITMLGMTALACNLTAESPPTLAPRQAQSTLTPSDQIGPESTIQAPPVTNQPLPSNVISDLPDNPGVTQSLQQVDPNRLGNSVRSLVNFQNRNAFSDPAPDRGKYATRDWLINEFRAIQANNPQSRIDVYTQPFDFRFNNETYPGDNVICTINGTDGEAGVIVLGAHYDTTGPVLTDSTSFQPGANDNGSGVASVLEIARIMAQRPHRATIVFVLFDAEEQARYGSQAFVKYIQDQNIPLRAAFNLDMVGNPIAPDGNRYDFQMRTYSAPPNDSTSRQVARLTELVARVYVSNMQVNIMDGLDRNGRWGDHQSFSDKGYPAIRLIEQQDDPRLVHNAFDTVDRVDANYLARTTQVSLAVMLVMADGPNSPAMRQMDTSTWRLEWAPSRDAVSYVVALRRPGSLTYDLEMTVNGTSMTWESFPNFEAVAVAAVDATGQLGPFSREQLIQQPPIIGQ